MVDFIVTPNVRHLAVRVSEPKVVPDARAYVWHKLDRAICGAPWPQRSFVQWDWSHLDELERLTVLDEDERVRWRRAMSRPVCLECARVLGHLVAATTTGVQR